MYRRFYLKFMLILLLFTFHVNLTKRGTTILHSHSIVCPKGVKQMIYLLEDDDSIRKLVLYGLDSQGFQAKASRPSEFWRRWTPRCRSSFCTSCCRRRMACPSWAQAPRPARDQAAAHHHADREKFGSMTALIGLDHGADDLFPSPSPCSSSSRRIRARSCAGQRARTGERRFFARPALRLPDRHESKVGAC